VVEQVNGSNPKPPQRFAKVAFLHWAARLKEKSGAEVHAVYEACGFGFGLQRNLTALEQSRLELGLRRSRRRGWIGPTSDLILVRWSDGTLPPSTSRFARQMCR
jgi:hypothetical protein